MRLKGDDRNSNVVGIARLLILLIRIHRLDSESNLEMAIQ